MHLCVILYHNPWAITVWTKFQWMSFPVSGFHMPPVKSSTHILLSYETRGSVMQLANAAVVSPGKPMLKPRLLSVSRTSTLTYLEDERMLITKNLLPLSQGSTWASPSRIPERQLLLPRPCGQGLGQLHSSHRARSWFALWEEHLRE